MSYIPEISEEQRQANIKKLVNQNKKLHQEIFLFEEQINQVLGNFNQEQRAKIQQLQVRRSQSRQKRSHSSFNNQQFPITKQKIASNQSLILNKESIQKLLQSNSPLIESKVIPTLKEQVEYLKATNIKENVHYILKEEDDLKIMKKQLCELRKEKKVVSDFIKDKSIRLAKQNSQLTNHKTSLRQELKQTIKFNRQSSNAITQLERQIRKYHLALQEYKKLSASTIVGGGNTALDSINFNPQRSLEQIQRQTKKLKDQIGQVQNKWKNQLNSLDKQYYQLKEQLQKTQAQQKSLRSAENFHKTRVIVMKDQQAIREQKERQKLVKVSPKLQKQIRQYLIEEQETLRKKQQYLKKHRPRDRDEEEYLKLMINSAAKAPNSQNTLVEVFHDDKNVVKLKNYLKQKQQVDKQIQAKLKKPNGQHLRAQRNWSRTQEEMLNQARQSDLDFEKKNKPTQQKIMPRILLKSVKLGTTFQIESYEDHQ